MRIKEIFKNKTVFSFEVLWIKDSFPFGIIVTAGTN